ATLLEYLLGRDAGIDQIIFRDTGHAYNVVRGRMSPYSALAFIGIGLALTLPRRSALRPVLYFGVLLSSLIGGASLLGYFWTAKELTTDVWLPPVALNTALAFLMLSIGTAIALRIPALHGLGAAGRQRVENKVLIAFVGALLLLCAGGGITYRMQVSFANSAQLVSDAQQVRTTLGELYGLIADAESEQRDYLLIGGAAYLSEYQRLSAQLGLRMQALRLLYAKDTPQPQAMDRLVGLIQRYQQTLGRELDLAATSDRDALRAAIAGDGTVEQMQGIRRSIKQLDAAEEDLLVTRARRLSLGRSYTLIALLATLTLSATILFVLFGSIIRDIRERARITAELDKARSEAQRAALAKSEFLAAMSHEIRTPMNGILGMLELLQQSSLMGRQLEMVQLTRESADSLLTIIDDILDFSKIEAGRLEIERSPIAVAEVVERSCALLDRVAERKQTTLTAFCDPAVPARLLGDSTRLRQILVNLINNAIKFSSGLERPGRVRVRVQLIERRADSALVEFLVSDNGIGMDEATLARLFGSFMQADVSTTRRYGGTGLGLAICKRLVDLMGGEIAVQSAADKGARFSVRLPLPIAPGAAPEPQQAQELSLLPCLVLGGEQGVADDLAAYLRADGAGVTRAADEKSIAPWAQAQPPGVAVCVIEAGEQLPRLAELRAGMQSRADLSVRTVCVVIGRALRNPRAETEGFVVLDGNALARRTLTEAVAIAAGRATRSAAAAPPLR
ncbi:MAG TPA: ATP-binding protein, partial [Steroidobacteraceae bacterium]|nr:ATP-binding protein [Steroidobacteraceae bacterium]